MPEQAARRGEQVAGDAERRASTRATGPGHRPGRRGSSEASSGSVRGPAASCPRRGRDRSVGRVSLWTSLQPASTTVDPGSTATVRLRLRNTGDVVDEYRLVPVGDIAPYVAVEPATIRLYPGTTGTVELTFAPPRTPDATA